MLTLAVVVLIRSFLSERSMPIDQFVSDPPCFEFQNGRVNGEKDKLLLVCCLAGSSYGCLYF